MRRPTRQQLADARLALLSGLRLVRARHPKTFCIGMQRSGTTSMGDFCETQLGMVRRGNVLSRRRGWSRLWYADRLDEVLRDPYFRTGEMFDDGPWWFPSVYETLFHALPDARFCMFTRDPDAWFRSLQAHSGGRSPGYTDVHARIYARDEDYAELAAAHGGTLPPDHANGFSLDGHAAHYKAIYTGHIEAVRGFFADHGADRLFVAPLDDPAKFRKLADFLGYGGHQVEEVWSNSIASDPSAAGR